MNRIFNNSQNHCANVEFVWRKRKTFEKQDSEETNQLTVFADVDRLLDWFFRQWDINQSSNQCNEFEAGIHGFSLPIFLKINLYTDRVASDHELQLIGLRKLPTDPLPKHHGRALLTHIPPWGRGGRRRPQQVKQQSLIGNPRRTANVPQLPQTLQLWTDPRVHAENPVPQDRCQRHRVKAPIKRLPNLLRIHIAAFLPKPVVPIGLSRLMGPPEEENILRVFQLIAEEQA